MCDKLNISYTSIDNNTFFISFSKFVGAFIDFPKPLIGLINGPAVGISVTTLGLYDAVYASDRVSCKLEFHILINTSILKKFWFSLIYC